MSGRTRLALCSYAATLLTAGALLPLVDEAGWLLQAAVLLGLQSGAGALARRVPLARPLTVALQVLVSLLALTVLFVRESAVAWLIPGPEAIAHFGQLFAAGYDDVSRYAIPAPATDGIRLMLIGGVLLIGLAVDALAVTYRAAAPAGLPLLALYTVAAGLSDGGTAWLWFLLAAAGYLLLLLAEGRDRLSRWGRVFGGAPPGARRGGALDGGGSAHAPVRTGRRIGVVALGVALAVPAALPALDGGLLDGTGSGPGRGSGGGGTISAVSPLVSLQENLNQPQNREVLRYRTNAPDPRSLYLRIVALDRFDGTAWRSSQRKVEDVPDRLPEPTGLSPAVDVTEVRTNLSAAGTYKQTWLPMPYPATKVGIEGRWRFEPEGRTLVGDRQTTAGVQYSVSSLVVQPTREQLANAPAPNSELKREYTQVPGSLPAEVAATAQRITKGAANDFERASKLQQWFAEDGGFTYSTRVLSGTGVAAIGRFLEEKRGFCVHFSFSMAAMARTLGIPARVAVGFTPGTPQSDGTVSVGLRDAHAWPELYFEGVGWTRFEPTPSRGTVPEYAREETPSTDPSAPAQPETGESSEPSSAPAAPDACPEHERRLGECGAAQPQEVAQDAEGGTPWTSVLFTALAVVGVVALLLLPLLWRALARRRRLRIGSGSGAPAGPAGAVVTDGPAGAVTVPVEDPAGTLAVWQEITDTAWDLGIPPDESQTPRKAAARIVRLGKLTDEPAAAMHRTARAVEEVLYAPTPRPATGLAEDAHRIRSGLRDAADTRTRLRALLLPRSSVRVVWALSDRWVSLSTRVSTRARKPLDRAAALLPRLSRGRG
ncbi:transglutaminaseTgpA domain-containing protein [Streptomyces sp. NPDC005805]|uniref:transglutaminase TgpA family protein n=1 Tax=Streptomyces sp. NPDC005805 TaxID=3157068 RepID=UPI0033C9C2FA